MTRYRYCTPALAGPWRNSPSEALDDALKAGQARPDPTGSQIQMLIGRIEQAEVPGSIGEPLRKAA